MDHACPRGVAFKGHVTVCVLSGIASGFTGMAFKGNVFGAEEAQTTLDTNFAGTRSVCERLAPLLADGGRVVNVCSSAGKLRILRSPV